MLGATDFHFLLTGTMPVIHHKDDLVMQEALNAWRIDPKNKSMSVRGDDRSPPWTWVTYIHHDGEHVAMPQDAIMAALRCAGAKMANPNKARETLKKLSQSALLIGSDYCRFDRDGKQVPVAELLGLIAKGLTFAQHVETVRKMGFDLLVKRAKLNSSRNVRVRPIFGKWTVSGTLSVSDPVFTIEVLQAMFDIAGREAGLLDWRPNSPKGPGPYGMFRAAVTVAKAGRRSA